MAPSRHDWKIVDWDVKPQHKQTIPEVDETEEPILEVDETEEPTPEVDETEEPIPEPETDKSEVPIPDIEESAEDEETDTNGNCEI